MKNLPKICVQSTPRAANPCTHSECAYCYSHYDPPPEDWYIKQAPNIAGRGACMKVWEEENNG